MSCVLYQPRLGVPTCSECDEPSSYHPLIEGNPEVPNPKWDVPGFDQWNQYQPDRPGMHLWWGDFLVMDGQPMDHAVGCECDEEIGPDPECTPTGPWRPALWLDTGAHGYMQVRWLEPDELPDLDRYPRKVES